MDICLAAARAAVSRINGAKSRGPKTPESKARSAQNALKHGFRAQKFVVVGDENAQEFAALEPALLSELAPEGVVQNLLAARIARAAWRLERAERIEAELFARHADRDRNLGLALIRDGHGSRAFDTLLRYRGTTLAELWRALRMLKALQREAAEAAAGAHGAPHDIPPPASCALPIEPEAQRNRGPTMLATNRPELERSTQAGADIFDRGATHRTGPAPCRRRSGPPEERPE